MGFNPTAQLLANRGYAVLQPNFRGSVGYGRKFLEAGNRKWGTAMRDPTTPDGKAALERGSPPSGRPG